MAERAGTIEHHADFPSHFRRAPRPVEVWLRDGYDTTLDTRYPVVYAHDGQFMFRHGKTPFSEPDWLWDADITMARMIDTGEIEPAIIVAVWADLDEAPNRGLEYLPEKPMADRMHTLEPKLAGGELRSERYLEFLVKELKPFIDRTYRTRPERESTMILGSSMGGVISSYAVSAYPDIFGAAACLSTAWDVGEGAVVDWYEEHWPAAGAHRIYFDYGTETYDTAYEPFQLKMDAVMQDMGFTPGEDWITRRFDGADHTPRAWRERLHVPLKFLLRAAA